MSAPSRKPYAALGVLTSLVFLPALVHAGVGGGFVELEEGINIVGLGVGQIPDYQGSDDYDTAVAPFARYYFSGQRYINVLGPQITLNILDDKVLQFGPMLVYRFGRNNDVEDSVVKQMREIDDTVEAGAFVAASYQLSDDPRNRFILSADLVGDTGDTHEGYIGTVGARLWMPVHQAVVIHVGGGFSYASEDYAQTYYGVSGADVALFPSLGGAAYNPDGGMMDVRATLGAVVHLSREWHLGVGARYQGLMNDAEDSPVVAERGDSDQWIYGVGLGSAWE
ncbi:MAG: MipA/OmpV family protein [Gammaproteobacteria bacterium]|nr:MipA/OmpV family protein [Gammaproteobacteria bacterium]